MANKPPQPEKPRVYYNCKGIKISADKGSWILNDELYFCDLSNLLNEVLNYRLKRELRKDFKNFAEIHSKTLEKIRGIVQTAYAKNTQNSP